MKSKMLKLAAAFYFFGSMILNHSALAKLGENEDSVLLDATHFGGAAVRADHEKSPFRVYEINAGNKKLTHFVANGKVVSTHYTGPRVNYKELIGDQNLPEFLQALKAARKSGGRRIRSRMMNVNTSTAVCTISLYLGTQNFACCLPSSLPTGVAQCP